MVFQRRRQGLGRALAALVVLLGSTEALAHQHPAAPNAHAHAAAPPHAHGPDCDHSRAAPPIDEHPGHAPDRADCSVCWAGAVGGKALTAPPLPATLPAGKQGTDAAAQIHAPRLKKLRAPFAARGPPALV